MNPAAIRGALPLPMTLLMLAGGAAAQVPVEESTAAPEAAETRMAETPATVAQTVDAARLGELFHRLQVLQQEVRELRGQVEEQAYRIERLTRQQQQQYIDLDERLLGLDRQGSAGAEDGPTVPVARVPRPVTPPVGSSATPEREAYAAAFSLMQESRFEESVDAFNGLIADYPNGQFTPNAFYWLGELRLAMDEVELARQSFAQVLTLYPQHDKVADTLYKLGVVHHRLNDNERALEYLDRVIAEHPDSTAADLARTYAGELR